jgi:hypothetical protein
MSPVATERGARGSQFERPAPKNVPVDLEPIRAAIEGIQFGEVRIVIQDGVVMQIDRVEKRRIR